MLNIQTLHCETNWRKYIAINNQEYTRKLPRRKFYTLRKDTEHDLSVLTDTGLIGFHPGSRMSDVWTPELQDNKWVFWPLSSWWFVPAQPGNYCRTHFSHPAGCQDQSFLTVFLVHGQRELSEGTEHVCPSEQSHSQWPAFGIYSVVLFATALFLFL